MPIELNVTRALDGPATEAHQNAAMDLVTQIARMRVTGDVIRDDGEVYTYAMDDDSGGNLDALADLIVKARNIVKGA